mmetsp:Transcript_14328/g.22221  ORF Transcript_14328/g.22221 Transcript_14328/m.22221 type:complete len:100 (-) Transcript_14328:576-875(-)
MAFDASASKSVVEESTEMSNLNPMFMCKAFYRQREILSKKTREAVKCPALVIHGKKDLVVPLEGDEGARVSFPIPKQQTSHRMHRNSLAGDGGKAIVGY